MLNSRVAIKDQDRRPPKRTASKRTAAVANPISDPYLLVSVLAVQAPAGATGSSWQRYEISQGPNRIVGYRQGRVENVTAAVEALVVQLNERRLYQRGRVHLALGPASGTAGAAVSR